MRFRPTLMALTTAGFLVLAPVAAFATAFSLPHVQPPQVASGHVILQNSNAYVVDDYPWLFFTDAIQSQGWIGASVATTNFSVTLPGLPSWATEDSVLSFALYPSVTSSVGVTGSSCVLPQLYVPLPFGSITVCSYDAASIQVAPFASAEFTHVSVGSTRVALPPVQPKTYFTLGPFVTLSDLGLPISQLIGQPITLDGTATLSLFQGTVDILSNGYNAQTDFEAEAQLTLDFGVGLNPVGLDPSQLPTYAYSSPSYSAGPALFDPASAEDPSVVPEPTTLFLVCTALPFLLAWVNGRRPLRRMARPRDAGAPFPVSSCSDGGAPLRV
jgi:hypothetical protein